MPVLRHAHSVLARDATCDTARRTRLGGGLMATSSGNPAPGWPGIEPRWTSSAKSGVGTALRPSSRVWFTVSHGILNEVYYPRIDRACLRDLGLMITDGHGFVSEEKRDTISQLTWLAPGVPGFRIENTCRQGRYRVVKEIVADPRRDVVLQRIRFEPLLGTLGSFRAHVLLAPHVGNAGAHNTAWTGEFKGTPVLFADRDGSALAVASSPGWTAMSAGFVGVSDGWQDLTAHGEMTWHYDRAEDGNVALMGAIDLAACGGTFEVALAFGDSGGEAAHRARASLLAGWADARDAFVRDWTAWQDGLTPLATSPPEARSRVSAAVLRCHEDKRLPGAVIASLSIPWGDSKSDNDLGGYHLVWPRDLVEIAGGLLAVGATADAIRILQYLRVTQDVDGSWPQNMWANGEAYWHGVQLDETAFPILLLGLVHQYGGATLAPVEQFWPMVRKAAAFIVCNGPATEQDRWEEEAGLSPFTVAVQVAALVVAADLADRVGEAAVAQYLRETADAWNDSLDAAIYVTDSELARRVGVPGYYVRIAAPEVAEANSAPAGAAPARNWRLARSRVGGAEMVSPDALALVRFGVRAPDDPRILDTVKVIDAVLKAEFPSGPVWRRYNGDQYGEHEGGQAFDGDGIGRPWPLLTGERAHYELAAGHGDAARRLLGTLEACANDGGLLPEQVWDAADVPEHELRRGGPTGSAMPLAWAHAEHVKLVRSLREGRVFDMPAQVHQRYVAGRSHATHSTWRLNHKTSHIDAGQTLRLETRASCIVRWSSDGWHSSDAASSHDTGLGQHVVDLPTATMLPATAIDFTLVWRDGDRQEPQRFRVVVTPPRFDDRATS